MTDIVIAITIMTAISIACGVFAATIGYSPKGQRVILYIACSVLAAVYFLFYASGQLFWAKFLPVSAAIVYSNFAAIFAALAAGWAYRLPKTPQWRRSLAAAMLATMSLAAINWPLLSMAVRPPPAGGNQWESGVAMQTSWATCSPAAAATLFRAEGIEVSEAVMVPLCLTDSSGTPTLGLYRGIKLISDRNNREVNILDVTLTQLLADNDWPVLLAVKLPYGIEDRRYADQWGWIPGMGHSVVALGRTEDGGIVIGDPSVGLERWNEDDMKVVWHGTGIRVSN